MNAGAWSRGNAAWALFLAAFAFIFVLSRPARAQGLEINGGLDVTEAEVGDLVTYTLHVASTNGTPPTNAELRVPQGFTLTDRVSSPLRSVSIINGRRTDKDELTASWQFRADKVGTFTFGPASVMVGSTRRSAPSATLTVTLAGKNKARAKQPSRGSSPFDPFGGLPFDPFGGVFPGAPPMAPDFPQVEPSVDPKLVLPSARAPVAFLHATVDKSRAVVGEQVAFSVYLYEDPRYRVSEILDPHEANAADFVKRALRDNDKAQLLGVAAIGGTRWSVKLIRKNALFPIKTGRLVIEPMSLTLGGVKAGMRESEKLVVEVGEPPIADRPVGYAIGDTGDFSLSATATPNRVEQHGAVGVTIELRGTGNFPSKLVMPEVRGVEWLEPEVRDALGPESEERYGGSRTFTYVARLHQAGAVNLGDLSLPFFNPATRKYQIARRSLGIVNVTPGVERDAGKDESEPVLAGLPPIRDALEGRHEASFVTEHATFWAATFGSPVLCLAALGIGEALRRARARHAERAPSPERIARERRQAAESALAGDDGAMAIAAIVRSLEADVLFFTGVNIRSAAGDATRRELEDSGLDSALAGRVAEVLSECEAARFAPSGVPMEMAKQLGTRASELRTRLETSKRSRHQGERA